MGITQQVVDVFETTGQQVVHTGNLVAVREETVTKMGAYETGSTGNQGTRTFGC